MTWLIRLKIGGKPPHLIHLGFKRILQLLTMMQVNTTATSIPALTFSWASLQDFTTLPLAGPLSTSSRSWLGFVLIGSCLSNRRGSGSVCSGALMSLRQGVWGMDRDWTGEDEGCLRLNIPSSSSSSMSHASLVLRANSWKVEGFLDLVFTLLAFGVSFNL